MSDTHRTSFKLRLPSFEVELEGTKAFVEEMFARLEVDLAPLMQSEAPASAGPRPRRIWVYGLTALYNKVYVISARQFAKNALARVLNPAKIRRVYIESADGVFDHLSSGSKTLWAEFKTQPLAAIVAPRKS